MGTRRLISLRDSYLGLWEKHIRSLPEVVPDRHGDADVVRATRAMMQWQDALVHADEGRYEESIEALENVLRISEGHIADHDVHGAISIVLSMKIAMLQRSVRDAANPHRPGVRRAINRARTAPMPEAKKAMFRIFAAARVAGRDWAEWLSGRRAA